MHGDWSFVPISEINFSHPSVIPSGTYIRAKKMDTTQLDSIFGKI